MVAYFKFPEAQTQHGSLRFHGTSFCTMQACFSDTDFKGKLAVAFEITKRLGIGLYFSGTVEGAFFYIHGGLHNLAALLILDAMPGTGKKTTNLVLKDAEKHNILGALVFKTNTKPATEPDFNILHPVLQNNLCSDSYKAYCLSSFGCFCDGRCPTPPAKFLEGFAIENVQALDTADETFRVEDFPWVASIEGGILHIFSLTQSSHSVAACAEVLFGGVRSDYGISSALSTGRTLCRCCETASPSVFIEKLRSAGPALFNDLMQI